jgi:hypothetical protein
MMVSPSGRKIGMPARSMLAVSAVIVTLLPGEGRSVFCALGEDDHQDGGEAVAGMKSLLV